MSFDLKSLESVATGAAKDLGATLLALGKGELADVVTAMQSFAAPAAKWEAERIRAQAAGDTATVDRINSDFDLLVADAVLRTADAGVLAQADTEQTVSTILSMLAKFTLAAALA
jgi:hypothetical protein